jgi:hypothetical protein
MVWGMVDRHLMEFIDTVLQVALPSNGQVTLPPIVARLA